MKYKLKKKNFGIICYYQNRFIGDPRRGDSIVILLFKGGYHRCYLLAGGLPLLPLAGEVGVRMGLASRGWGGVSGYTYPKAPREGGQGSFSRDF